MSLRRSAAASTAVPSPRSLKCVLTRLSRGARRIARISAYAIKKMSEVSGAESQTFARWSCTASRPGGLASWRLCVKTRDSPRPGQKANYPMNRPANARGGTGRGEQGCEGSGMKRKDAKTQRRKEGAAKQVRKTPPLICVSEVGTPVARRPPHGSRRAVCPHRALHLNSLSHLHGT